MVLDGGRVLGQGELSDVLGHDRVFRLADSLGLESLLTVDIVERDPNAGLVRARLGENVVALPEVDEPLGTRALVAVRPEDVILARGPVPGTSIQNAIPGTVARIDELSDRLLVSVDVGGILRAEISAKAGRDLELRPGATIHCLVKAFSFRWRRFLGASQTGSSSS